MTNAQYVSRKLDEILADKSGTDYIPIFGWYLRDSRHKRNYHQLIDQECSDLSLSEKLCVDTIWLAKSSRTFFHLYHLLCGSTLGSIIGMYASQYLR